MAKLIRGAEISFLAPADAVDYGIGMLNANASYYVPNATRFRPFVTGGYSLGFRTGIEHGWNAGAGVEFWGEHVGVRLEVRDQVLEFRSRDPMHFWGARLGITFR